MTATYTSLLPVRDGIVALQLRPFGVQQLEKIKHSFAVPQAGDISRPLALTNLTVQLDETQLLQEEWRSYSVSATS